MRAVRAGGMATLTLLLLGAWSGAAIAAAETDPMASACFTFREPSTEPLIGDVEVGYHEATDPRASGRTISVTDMSMLATERGGLATGATRMGLVNDGGAWTGTSQGVHFITADGGATTLTILMGKGGYEGLTLVMVEYADDDVQTRRGAIIPSDQMPSLPGPLELPSK